MQGLVHPEFWRFWRSRSEENSKVWFFSSRKICRLSFSKQIYSFFSDDLHLPTDHEVPLEIHLSLRSRPCTMESLFWANSQSLLASFYQFQISNYSASDQSACSQGAADRDARHCAVLHRLGLRQLSGAVVLSSFCLVVVCSFCTVIICSPHHLLCSDLAGGCLRSLWEFNVCLQEKVIHCHFFFSSYFFWKMSDIFTFPDTLFWGSTSCCFRESYFWDFRKKFPKIRNVLL